MRVAIIGGGGKMGQWFARQLGSEGYDILIADPRQCQLKESGQNFSGTILADNTEAVKRADVVIISVPIDTLEEVITEIAPRVRPDQIILDITSVKVLPVSLMHRHVKTGLVLGTHPVFGPGAGRVANHNIVLTPTNDRECALAEKIRAYLESRKAKVSLMTPEDHDELMAVVLGLAHFIAITAADALVEFGRLKELRTIGGVTYRALLTLIESVISEDATLYASIQMSLPKMPLIHDLFSKSTGKWAKLVKGKNRAEFIERMNALRNHLEENDADFGRAYQNMYRLAEGK
jgi:prephenate dehydrogenase